MENQSLRTLLQEATSTTTQATIHPFLTDRIMDQVTSLHRPQHQFFQTLWDTFKPVAFICLMITIGFITYNIVLSRNYEVALTPVEIIFGLEPMTLTTTYLTDIEDIRETIP